jgi:uracil DNA glycosylase superfamily protein
MKPKEFVSAIQAPKFANVFNPYADRCSVYDVSDAPSRRARALLELLEAAAQTEVDALWMGRDLGYRGGRRTGLAFTDDVHLAVHAARWNVSIERATTGSFVAERTAAVIWKMLSLVPAAVFLWNVFPFHPHDPGDPFSNRSHRPPERAVGEELLAQLVAMLRPRRLVAIGNDAAKAARRLGGTGIVPIRHPSYGGQRDFISQVQYLYGLRDLGERNGADEPVLHGLRRGERPDPAFRPCPPYPAGRRIA